MTPRILPITTTSDITNTTYLSYFFRGYSLSYLIKNVCCNLFGLYLITSRFYIFIYFDDISIKVKL